MADTTADRAADVLARRLHQAGCRHAFGLPGGEVLTVIDALERAGITFHLAKHENAAGFIGEGVHHVDGAPVILVATVGPGAVNGVNVVANAHQDRVPMIVLTGCVDAHEAETYSHQVLDHRAVFAPVTKATFTLTPEAADVVADKAVIAATEGRCGPVLIDVPIAVADAPATLQTRRRGPMARAVPAPDDLSTARDWLAGAERPLIVAGLDILYDDSAAELTALAKALGAPVITTYKAKGVIAEDHPLSLGGAGLSPLADSHLLPLVRQADVILAAGYDPIEMRTGWRAPWDATAQKVIDLGTSANMQYMHGATLNIVADTKATLAALCHGLPPLRTWPGSEPAQTRTALTAAFPTNGDWGAAAVIATARAALPPETIATVDSGAHRILLSQIWTCPAPRRLLQSSGLCTMGCAVPLAIGAKLAAPDTPVVSFSGDAGFLMVAGELASATDYGVAPIFVVLVDASLALIELKQRQRQMPNTGVDFGRRDYAAIGRAFGGHGVTVRSRSELEQALTTALAADRFTVIAAEIPPRDYDGRI